VALYLPYFSYQDIAGNFGLKDVELTMEIGATTQIDRRLGEVGA
jgi:hypothetical protein